MLLTCSLKGPPYTTLCHQLYHPKCSTTPLENIPQILTPSNTASYTVRSPRPGLSRPRAPHRPLTSTQNFILRGPLHAPTASRGAHVSSPRGRRHAHPHSVTDDIMWWGKWHHSRWGWTAGEAGYPENCVFPSFDDPFSFPLMPRNPLSQVVRFVPFWYKRE